MKPLVSASYAQFGVDAGDEEFWATRNGIRISTQFLWRPALVVNLYVVTTDDLLRSWIETCIVAKVMCSVACLEWESWDR